ncbi:MAG: hypothetical protein HFI17_13665 [Lachnospiraceae bacterium]|jgi:hypothetical protein|nr:hypothetical protein [Lachnospiraceae bacterium]
MSGYTYTLNRKREEPSINSYKRNELEKMTTFHLREICRKERLVIPSSQSADRESLVRLIMRFRGQKEYRHIQNGCEGGLERIQEYLCTHDIFLNDQIHVQIPGTITLYQGTQMNELDGCMVRSEETLYEGNLLLVDETYQVYTCFYIQEVQGNLWLFKGKDVPVKTLEKHQYFILYLTRARDSEFLYDCYYKNRSFVPGTLEAVRIPLLDIQEKKIAEAELPLIIDLGSSNTTMGICLPDGSTRTATVGGTEIIPSLIGVKKSGEKEAEFVFGQEARTLEEQNYRDEDVAVFYDIKRWISDPNRQEGVILPDGYKYQFSRREMLRAYLEYLLDLARQQFKCIFSSIQLLAPVRQKEKFQTLFKELLPEYKVNCELDEGMAVLFYSINRLIAQKQYEGKHWYRALIIDCGGGTTDLTSGRFCIDNNRVSYQISLETRYENGDTNFGGNNLTWRILQILKIRIAQALGFMAADGMTDISEPSMKRLDALYQQAENWIPTRFKEYEEKGREQYFFVKNNYYYLFELAEQVKKAFFQPDFCYGLTFSTRREPDEKKLYLDKWRLSVCKNGQFGYMDRLVEFSLFLNEVEEILRPDIQSLMARFLEQKFERGQLQNYEMIKLTGQSCKSRLFTEALKEYVPGKLIQSSRQEQSGAELKLCCLKGALAYFFNCRLGYMNVSSDYQVGSLPYEIRALTHENQEKILIHSLDPKDHIGYISRFRLGNQLDLYLNDEQGRHLKTCYYEYDTSAFARTTQEEIDQNYGGTVIQEETDTIVEGEMKFFVWVSRKRWGFIILPILRDGELLYKGEETFFDFEDDTWELNFFDGRK